MPPTSVRHNVTQGGGARSRPDEYRTSHIDEIRSLSEQWVEETKGKRTATRSVLGRDPRQPGTYVLVVEFPSREVAVRNSSLPATSTLAEAIGKLVRRSADLPGHRRHGGAADVTRPRDRG